MLSESKFKERLEGSKADVQKVGEWLKGKGFDVLVRPTICAPNKEERYDYADDGDIEIRFRVEVKKRHNVQFTCKEDYPYPTIFLDETYKVDGWGPGTLYAYIVLSKDAKHAALVPRNTRMQWVKRETWDTVSQRSQQVYEVPKDLAHFVEL